MVSCHRNVNFQEIDPEPSTGGNDGICLLWEILNDDIKQNIIMVVLMKPNSHSIDIGRLIKKSAM